MTDLNKERELYESVIEKTQGIKMEHLVGISFNAEANQYEISGEKWACELTDACEELNTGWFIWQECVKAKAQAVQQSFEIGRLQDRITELLDERQDLYAQINNDQAVPDTQQKLTDTYYLEGSDYVVDCPFEYDIEIDKGEVLELQKWQRTESTKVYFANIYKDEDNFEILQFASKAEAENAVAENLKFLEASESGAEQ
ncbi:hypothetical protein N7565_15810 [Acinetobacter baumannii]|uniref:hypothetical protein n=2 Tax=Acinetobacter baumannii TaxID=470 RepID=UPI0005FAE5BF|nr:hypothetical protein [Acinetobacter baumannii]MDG9778894.1 hypothetical protein [Acinetobacter baumannii]MDH0780308.1 hypothetical protein [Acinetobacter baumannii]MDO7443689.1 hypothetical protein [Acinetobacter baumannii]OTK38846.1 hypothetical protein B9X74_07015 [Acinetobacter baumannii]HEO1807126.1 hypothetical protein [Acinetobacter baumannii]